MTLPRPATIGGGDGRRSDEESDCNHLLFLDIGGVLLTNGWDHRARRRVATNFKLQLAEMEDRHHLTFDTYEEGKLTIEEYLSRVIFYQNRSFTRAQFQKFMFAQSRPYP
jgi:putative hydrolase of the HAD superfamily